jgi:hypothetical protein
MSKKQEVAVYLENHMHEWCYIADMARAILGNNSSTTRRVVRSAFGNARYLLESRGLLVIPKFEQGKKGVEAYKIATPDDKDYIIKDLLQRKGRYEQLAKRTLMAFNIVKNENLLKQNETPALIG